MAFTVEDGTGLAEATSYLSLAGFRAFHLDRGVDALEATYPDTDAQGALVRATDYVDKRFGSRFRGWKQSSVQALEWPRTDAYDDDSYPLANVPVPLEKSIAEYALLSLQLARNLAPVPGLAYPIVDPSTGEVTAEGGGAIKSKKEKVDVLEESISYENGPGGGGQLPAYPQADLWLSELVENDRKVTRG